MSHPLIRRCEPGDFDAIWTVINDGAAAYQGHVPADRLRNPYMSREELTDEIAEGVQFWGYEEEGMLLAVMGLQHLQHVHLIRHAYVRSAKRNQGIGSQLLRNVLENVQGPVLIGTWADASWAIHFYERHGFRIVPSGEKERLLRTYWKVPERQIETSAVLANEHWHQDWCRSDPNL